MIGPLILTLIGFIGGTIASLIGAPIPYLLGSLAAVAMFVVLRPNLFGVALSFPMRIREAFVVVIGTMIGGTFKVEGLAEFQHIWMSVIGVGVFILACLWSNYMIFKRIGGYSRANAFYASLPGGLVDSVTLGEQAGGDPRILTIQHFVRIVLIVTIVPLGFWIWTGEAVGSSAGMSLDVNHVPITLRDYLIIGVAALIGYVGGRVIRLPAYFFIGPLLMAALVHGTGITHAQLPDWMLSFAQLVVGTGFGARFGGMDKDMLLRGLKYGILSSFSMLLIGLAVAFVLYPVMGQSLEVMFLCFAPGGISEMGLIALSLQANPVFVTAHHLIRILATIGLAGAVLNRVKEND